MELINHDLRCVNGQTIYLPKWKGGEDSVGRKLTIPDVYVLDTIQQYPIGTKFVDDDRVFHYGYCHSNASVGGRAMGGMMNTATAQAITGKAVIHAVGETAIVLVDSTSTVNQWAGGYLMPRVHPYSSYRVLSNTATDATNVTLTLERGLLTAMASGEDGFLNQNPYSKLSCQLPNAGKADTSAMGVNLVTAVAGSWMWIQTWGPCYVTGGDELLGTADFIRDTCFGQDGTLYSPAAFNRYQRAGYALNECDGTSTWFIMLQLDP